MKDDNCTYITSHKRTGVCNLEELGLKLEFLLTELFHLDSAGLLTTVDGHCEHVPGAGQLVPKLVLLLEASHVLSQDCGL